MRIPFFDSWSDSMNIFTENEIRTSKRSKGFNKYGHKERCWGSHNNKVCKKVCSM